MENHRVALVTGANGYLGQCICRRLITEISTDHKEVEKLTIVVTSRTFRTVTAIVKDLQSFTQKLQLKSKCKLQVSFDYLLFDQTDMVSVLTASYQLQKRFTHLDYIFFNSSHSQMGGIDYWQATKDFFTNPIRAFTVGTFKIQGVARKSGDGMGATFEANVFAPYFLVQHIKESLLHPGSRLIWISTSISLPEFFDPNDIGIEKSEHSYECSKYELELLHQATYKQLYEKDGIQSWLLQPGVFKSTTFVPTMNIFMYISMLVMFYICRWFGSPYHCIYPELASNAPIWCALKADPKVDSMGIKYGSSTSRLGSERLMRSNVDFTEENAALVLDYVKGLEKEWDEKLKDQVLE